MLAVATVPDSYAGTALNPEVHARLIADIDNFAWDAGITANWIKRPLKDGPAAPDLQWIRRYKFHTDEGKHGYCLTGKNTSVTDRMAAIAGALVRNFVRARVLPMSTVLDQLDEGITPICSCLLIPNFFLGKSLGGTLATWKVLPMLDLLMARQLQGQQTVIYVSDLKLLASEYGSAFADHIEKHFYVTSA
jgi:hypothetical protein